MTNTNDISQEDVILGARIVAKLYLEGHIEIMQAGIDGLVSTVVELCNMLEQANKPSEASDLKPSETFQALLAHLRNPNNKITAIRELRDSSKLGLRQAKDAVELWSTSVLLQEYRQAVINQAYEADRLEG